MPTVAIIIIILFLVSYNNMQKEITNLKIDNVADSPIEAQYIKQAIQEDRIVTDDY